ncbi:MAG: FtsX-like permease family protein [Spirochaetes bacterium]|nr:FtsX-like permease family protein [Spirochaetota bacterium]
MDRPTIRRGGFGALLSIAYRNIWRNGRRTGFCVAAVAIAVFFNIFMQAWIEGMIGGIEEVVRTYDMGHVNAVTEAFDAEREYLPVQFPLAGGRDWASLAAEVRALPGVRAALPRISAWATLFDSSVKHAMLWGIDLEAERKVNLFNLTRRDDGLVEGRWPRAGTNECAIGTALSLKGGYAAGDKLPLKTVSAQFSDKYWNPTIVGIFDFDYRRFDEGAVIVPFDRLGRLLALDGATQSVVMYAEDPARVDGIKEGLSGLLGAGHVVRGWQENYWVSMLRKSTFLYLVVFGVFQVVASFLIINTILMVIHERIKEIGMMGALGMTRAEIVLVFFLEAISLSVLGAAIGCAVGAAATFVGSLFPVDLELFSGGGMKDLPMSGTIFVKFTPGIIAGGFAFGVAVSAACTLVPSLKSAFIRPVEALRR